MDEDDPETIALRSAAYVDAVNDAEAFLLEKEINVPVEVLIDRFTIIINVRKRGARNAS
jgi:hypothetical protein